MFLSRKTTYGLRALYLLAECESPPLLAREIAGSLDLPKPFLSKILQDLTKGGVLISSRGRRGGFRLAKPPSRIRLMKVIELLEGKKLRSQCVLGSAECSEKNICLIRSQCGPIRKEVERIFSEMDLRQLLEEAVDSSAQPLPGLFAESTWADEG